MKKNYDYEEIERWARAGFAGAEKHAKYSPKRNTEENEITVERQGGFFRSFGFQLTAALLVMLIVSGGIFAALKHMERIAEMNGPAQSSESESSTLQEPLNIDDIKLFYVTTGGRDEPRYWPFSTPTIERKYGQDGSVTETVHEYTPDYTTVIDIFGNEEVRLHHIYSGRPMFKIGSYVYDENGNLLYSGEEFSASEYLKDAPLGTYLVQADVSIDGDIKTPGYTYTVWALCFTVIKNDEGGQTLPETEPETATIEPPYIENGKYPAYLSVTSGAETIYPDAYMLYTEEYDDDNDVWLSADGIGAAGAERVPLIGYDGTKNISIDYYEGIDVANIVCRYTFNGKTSAVTYGYVNDFFSRAEDGVYRFVIAFVINGRQIGSKYECVCYEYPFDVEVKRDNGTSDGWDGLTKTERIERALDEITAYGMNYQRWRYLCGADHADDIYDHGGYYIDDPAEAEFTFDYLLGKFDAETDPKRKALMFSFISAFLGSTWDSELRFPYYTKYLPDITWFENDSITYDETLAASCDKWIREDYYNAFCEYAAYMTEAEVKANYPASYKLIKKYGFNGFSDSARSAEQKANRTVQEFFNMALSVKYGVAVSDPSSDAYVRYNEIFDEKPYGPGDNVYKALLKFYDKDQLDNENSAPVAFEQRGGIKYINDWRSYFTSLTSKEIADGFIKESKCFLTTSGGLVLTVDNYYFFNTNNLNTPSAGELYSFKVNGDKATARLFVDDPDDNKNYTVEFSVKDGEYKITGGTLITEWLERTLSVEECQIRDTVMDVEHLFQIINSGVVNGFRYYGFDDVYNIEYGKNENLPEGLEEALNEKSVYEMSGKTYYISHRVFHSSYGLRTYDDWIRYFSNILPADLVKAYIKEAPLYAHHGRDVYSFLIVNNEVFLLDITPQSWYEIDYSTFRIIGEKDGVTTVSAVLTGIYTASVSQNNFEVTFELVKTDDTSFRYRVTGGTFIDMFMDSKANISKAAHSAYKLIRASDLLLCADPSVVYITEYWKYNGEEDGTAYYAYNYYGKELFSDLLDFSATEQIRNAVMKDTEVMKWVEDDQHTFYPVIYPDRAEFTIRPKFAKTQDMTVHGLIENMKNYKETDEKITFSLDFILEYKNGKTENVTYTFEIDKTDGCRVTGGTFVTEFILAE